jgi:iron complex outermembrane receptor protein
MANHRGLAASFAVCLAWVAGAHTAAGEPAEAVQPMRLAAVDLKKLSIEELQNMQVTSVGKHPERLADAPASIFVITSEAIRNSGATTLPEVLRLAPNLLVAQTGAATYSISARGFNIPDALANKLLVLIDGRTVYSPIYSGVFWDQQDVMLEDVERIEVVSGPGGTLWGANAVNGVINIMTKAAGDTQGGLLTLGSGNNALGGSARYGGKLGERGYLRVYGKAFDLDPTDTLGGTPRTDGWQMRQGGFRADWLAAQPGRKFTVQGDAYEGKGETRGAAGALEDSGVNLLARWTESFDSGADLHLQAYFDRSNRADRSGFQGDADTWDIELQHGIPLGAHKALWGAGYRRARDEVRPSTIPAGVFALVTTFVPQRRMLDWANVFAQTEVSLGEAVKLTGGVKFERNDYTGWETLPSVRLAWKPADEQLLWGAVSRAVRAPARLDRDFFYTAVVPGTSIVLPIITGGPQFISETADVAELGYRAQPWRRFSYSVTAFYSEYDHLRSGQPPPALIQNMIDGKTYGGEAWATYEVSDWWRLHGGVTTLHQDLRLDPASTDPEGPRTLGNDPSNHWLLRTLFSPTARQDLSLTVRRVSSLPDPAVPGYTALDLHFAWRVHPDIELSVTGNNLLDDRHPEFGALPGSSAIERSVYGRIRWAF